MEYLIPSDNITVILLKSNINDRVLTIIR